MEPMRRTKRPGPPRRTNVEDERNTPVTSLSREGSSGVRHAMNAEMTVLTSEAVRTEGRVCRRSARSLPGESLERARARRWRSNDARAAPTRSTEAASAASSWMVARRPARGGRAGRTPRPVEPADHQRPHRSDDTSDAPIPLARRSERRSHPDRMTSRRHQTARPRQAV